CMDIRWGKTTREVPQRGLEVVFALDVSRSMLAQDAKPNRLARAKQQIKDMLAEMAGDRVGLVVFAGDAKQAVPLTNHYHDFQEKLDSVGPDSVSVGGSRLGVAIKAASDAFLSKTNDYKTMVLFTDGEDQESKPIELAKQLHAETGLRIFTVGLGDVTEGARIPENAGRLQRRRGEQFVQHNGQQVWSKLNGSVLKKIATESDGAYIPAGIKRVNMADVYHQYIANVEKSEFETAKINAFVPRFQWFAFPAFLCLWLHFWLSVASAEDKVASALNRTRSLPRSQRNLKVAKAAAVMLLLCPAVASGQEIEANNETVAARINAANELVRENKTTDAINAYNSIEGTDAEYQDELNYNLATAHYRNSDIDAAIALFAESATSSNDQIASNSRYNLGNCRYAKALPLAEEQSDAAIAELQQAISHFRSALRLNRSLSDARENLERATKLIEQLRQQQKDDQQDQQSQQNDQDNQQSEEKQDSETEPESDSDSDSDQQSDSQQEQDPDSEESQENQESKKSDDSDASQEGEDSQKGQSEQQSGSESEDSKQESDQQSSKQQGDQSNGGDEVKQQSDSAQGDQDGMKSQQNADRSPQSGQEDAASESAEKNTSTAQEENDGKQTPEGELSAANASEAEDGLEDKNAVDAIAQQADLDNGMMTRQEALKLLQAVRDRDMIRRYQQRQRQRQRRVPVEKDW
ncbi:VWA domain-containing protein, partial [Mariniblastus sp.]|nr:VWA domain-containing protein [Mariniblastus sp.]